MVAPLSNRSYATHIFTPTAFRGGEAGEYLFSSWTQDESKALDFLLTLSLVTY